MEIILTQLNQMITACRLASRQLQEMCCWVEQNSQPFQPHDAATINALADGGRNCLSGYNSYQWLTVCKKGILLLL